MSVSHQGEFQWPQISASFMQKKAIKIINWRCLPFVISSNLLMLDYKGFFQQKAHIYPGCSLASSQSFLRAVREAVPQLLSSLRSPKIDKHS